MKSKQSLLAIAIGKDLMPALRINWKQFIGKLWQLNLFNIFLRAAMVLTSNTTRVVSICVLYSRE